MSRAFVATTSKSTTAEVLRAHGHDPHSVATAIQVFTAEGQRALDDHDYALASRMFAAICQHNAALLTLKRRSH